MNGVLWRRAAVGAGVLMPAALLAMLWMWPPLVAQVSQSQGVGERTLFLPQGRAAEQTFEAAGEHIDGVGVLVLMPGGGDGAITVSVRPERSAGTDSQRSVVVRRSDITPTEMVHVRFPRLATTPGDRYSLEVRTDAVMSLGSAGRDGYPRGELKTSTEQGENDLIFRVYRVMNGHDLTRELVGAPAWVAALLLGVAGCVAAWAMLLVLRLDLPAA